jgi:hypothetical protein
MSVEVVLDIYSGRENPRWHLDRAGITRLEQLLHTVQKKTNELPQPPALGYRGFHLQAVQEKLPAHITVFDGVVQTESGNFRDPARRLEKWLVEEARHVVDANTYSYLKSSIPN